ncbi:uncharacterized protein LOC142338260 [Convolutriloba macropyga]|uniref:uncharacterized protein LOC142338260 n=1 Tax=Convolutriloba macropyga TaxID=536237 RepID=UPI003F5261D1
MVLALVFLTLASFTPLLQVALLSCQLLGNASSPSYNRNVDLVQLWVSIFTVLFNSIGTGVLFDYLKQSFSFETYGPSSYLIFVCIGLSAFVLLFSAVRISTSKPQKKSPQIRRQAQHGGSSISMTSRPNSANGHNSRSGTLDSRRGGGVGGGGENNQNKVLYQQMPGHPKNYFT